MTKEKKEKSLPRKIIEWFFFAIFIGLFLFLGIGQITSIVNRNSNYGQSLVYGYGNFIVQTDSMEPDYKVGSAIITHKDDVEDIYKLYLENCEYNQSVIEKYEDKFNKAGITQQEEITLIAEMEKEEKHIDITFFDYYQGESYKPSSDSSDPIVKTLSTRVTSGTVMTHRLREMIKKNDKYIFFTSGINISEHYSGFGQYQVFSEDELLGVVKLNSSFLGTFFSFVSSVWGLLILLLIPALYLVITSVLEIVKALNEKDEEVVEAVKGDSLDSLSKEDQERLKRELLEEMMNNKDEK